MPDANRTLELGKPVKGYARLPPVTDLVYWLFGRGYSLTPNNDWRSPANHTPTKGELAAIDFLIAEYDFGGILPTTD